MPLYLFRCNKCDTETERVGPHDMALPTCCGQDTEKVLTCFAFVKMKGEGGYPARRKMVKGTAPGTTQRGSEAWLSSDPELATQKHGG